PTGLRSEIAGEIMRDRMWDFACGMDSGNSFQGSLGDFNNRLYHHDGPGGGSGGDGGGAPIGGAAGKGAGSGGGIVPPSPQLVGKMYAAHQQNVEEAKKLKNWDHLSGNTYRKNEFATAVYQTGTGLTLSKPQKGYWQDGVPKSEVPGGVGRVAGVHVHVTGNGRHLLWDRDMATQNNYISGTGSIFAPGRLEIFVPSQIQGVPGAYFHTDDGVRLVPGR
ncbi:MAG: hypothetical protein WAO00_09265, partial [Chthoniobacterales bacterium]